MYNKIALLTLLTLQTVTFGLFGGACARCEPERCFRPPAPVPMTEVLDPFNEKQYWLEEHDRSGSEETWICSRRLFLQDNIFDSTNIRCTPAQKLEKSSAIGNGAECWYADGTVLCSDGNGRLKAFTKTQKICGAEPKKGVVLGHVKNSERNRAADGTATCAIVKKQD